MRDPSARSDESHSVAAYLADREGLEGQGRETFLHLLHNGFGFRPRRSLGPTVALTVWIAVLVLAGSLLEWERGPQRIALLAWIGNVAMAALLIFALVRAARQPRRSSWNLEWRVYRLLIRPIILSERPGLLDCNSARDAEVDAPSAFRFRFKYLTLWDDSWPNLWLPATVGWGLGVMTLLGWRVLAEADVWIHLLPLAGTVLIPLGWGLFRLFTFWRMEKAVKNQP